MIPLMFFPFNWPFRMQMTLFLSLSVIHRRFLLNSNLLKQLGFLQISERNRSVLYRFINLFRTNLSSLSFMFSVGVVFMSSWLHFISNTSRSHVSIELQGLAMAENLLGFSSCSSKI